MYCINCGEQISNDLTRCPACGADTAPSEQTLVRNMGSDTVLVPDETVVSTTPVPVARQLPVDLEPGRVLGNRYEIRNCIGSGGMGAIYAARRIHIGDIVAVKVLRPDVITDAQSRERFQREARAAAKLHHPNAVVIHDFGQDPDGLTYIVMELLEGRNLREVLNAERSLAPPKALQILKQACAAIEAAHRLGIIHRDIKPDNIILLNSHDETEHVKILDFGIAKLLDRNNEAEHTDPTLTQVGTVIGTPNYMSPEQCQGEPLDARSDVYSLGVVLYEMLTGVQPFTARNSTGVVIKHVTERPRPLTALKADIPSAVEQVVLKSLEKKPEARHQSALDLARDFEAALRNPDSPQLATPASPFRMESKPAATPKAVVAAAPKSKLPLFIGGGTVILFALGFGVWLTLFSGKEMAQQKVSQAAAGTSAALPPSSTQAPTAQVESTPTVAPEGMVIVMGGEFQMGRNEGDDIDAPAHPAKVLPFFIDQHEVTNAQYREFLQATGHPAPPDWKAGMYPDGQSNFPVTDVTWEDATAFAKWAGKRLPTEAEWEYAARGSEGRLYPWGNEYVGGSANVKTDGATTKGKENLAPVGSYPQGQSMAGLMDMVGNVWEWTDTDLKAYPGGKLPAQEGYKNLKVIRGGSWSTDPKQATNTLRRGWPANRSDWPTGVAPDYSTTGFRCAKSIS